jgi:hypothetical protein
MPGREPDSCATLKADGLINMHGNAMNMVELIEPDNLRVIAWVLGVNRICRSAGLPNAFAGFEEFEFYDAEDLIIAELEGDD